MYVNDLILMNEDAEVINDKIVILKKMFNVDDIG